MDWGRVGAWECSNVAGVGGEKVECAARVMDRVTVLKHLGGSRSSILQMLSNARESMIEGGDGGERGLVSERLSRGCVDTCVKVCTSAAFTGREPKSYVSVCTARFRCEGHGLRSQRWSRVGAVSTVRICLSELKLKSVMELQKAADGTRATGLAARRNTRCVNGERATEPGNDDSFLFTMRGLLTPVSWLGKHTKSAIAAMADLELGGALSS
ncbi:hypothetical protein Tco_1372165 [Tanacetum coccineum]